MEKGLTPQNSAKTPSQKIVDPLVLNFTSIVTSKNELASIRQNNSIWCKLDLSKYASFHWIRQYTNSKVKAWASGMKVGYKFF